MISENHLLHTEKQPEHIARSSKTLCLKANLFAVKYCGLGSSPAQQLRELFLSWMAKAVNAPRCYAACPAGEEQGRAALCSTAEALRAGQLCCTERNRQYLWSGWAVSPVSLQFCCHAGPLSRCCHSSLLSATWMDAPCLPLLLIYSASGPGCRKSEPSPCPLISDGASLLVSWKSLSPKAAVCVE